MLRRRLRHARRKHLNKILKLNPATRSKVLEASCAVNMPQYPAPRPSRMELPLKSGRTVGVQEMR